MLTRRTVRTPAPRCGRTAPAAFVRASAMSVFLGRAVRTATAVRRRVAKLAFLLIAVVFMFFRWAVWAAGPE